MTAHKKSIPYSTIQICHSSLDTLCLWRRIWLASLLLLAAGVAEAQELRSGALLLKETDRVLTGTILQRADFYEVEIAPNSRVSIPTAKVAYVAASLEELYQFKLANVSQNSIGDHYQLTRWCLLNGLLPQAAKHYQAVTERNPDHPRVKQLGVELEEQLLRDEKFREYLGLAPLSTTSPTPAPRPELTNVAPQDSRVLTASTAESSHVVHPDVAQRFATNVQPILLSRCSQAACHGVQGPTSLRLLEPYGKSHSQTVTSNLTNTLAHISTNAEQLSPLLHFATTAHGTQKVPAISPTEVKLVQELKDWINFVNNPVVSAVVNGSTVGLAVSGLNPVDPGGAPLRRVPQASAVSAGGFPVSGFPVGTQPPSLEELDALDAQLSAELGEANDSAVPTSSPDPFDPSEFNRKTQSQRSGQ